MDQQFIDLSGTKLPVSIKENVMSRKISLRYNKIKGLAIVTIPKRYSKKKAFNFALKHKEWLEEQLEKSTCHEQFIHDASLFFNDEKLLIKNIPQARRGVWREDNIIYVSGNAEHLHRRVKDFLKKEIKNKISSQAKILAKQIDCEIGKITVRDQTTRWGSCSQNGNLSFSWRLALAPDSVLQYVIAHEIAHLKELNHSAKFWKIVRLLCPEYKKAQRWLKVNAASLYKYK